MDFGQFDTHNVPSAAGWDTNQLTYDFDDVPFAPNLHQNEPDQEIMAAEPAANTGGRERRQCQWEPEWEQYREIIKQHYMEGKKSLPEVRDIMQTRYGFDKKPHQYKKKFEHWGWQKKLPQNVAKFVVECSNKRKREQGKETIFTYGEMEFKQDRAVASVKRARPTTEVGDLADITTPEGLVYKTPRGAQPLSPHAQRQLGPRSHEKDVEVVELPSVAEDGEEESDVEIDWPRLTWRGLSLTDLPLLVERAQLSSGQGDSKDAEKLFVTAIQGFKRMLGAFHEDTVTAMYQTANFFAQQDRTLEADRILDDISLALIRSCGRKSRRFQGHILHAASLLNGWGREATALALLSNARGQLSDQDEQRSNGKQRVDEPVDPVSQTSSLFPASAEVIDGSNCADSDYVIRAVQSSSDQDLEAAENVLQTTIRHCENSANGTEIQTLRARAELLKLFTRQNCVQQNFEHFDKSRQEFRRILSEYHWYEHKLKSIDVMQALLELVAVILKAGHREWAAGMFQSATSKAEVVYGEHEERTIWIMISVGLVYQNYLGWKEGSVWFDAALSAALASLGEEDGITQSLIQSRQKKRFSYVTDEGRPFKTIFGVAEMRIRPGRLHLD